MQIHPKIKELQLRVNKLAIDYEIEDCVMAVFNYEILFISLYFISNVISYFSDDKLVDYIYLKYNQY